MSRFAKLLNQKEARDDERYSQADIARATGLSPAVVSRWMKGEIDGASLSTVKKLCDWLDCDVGDLVTIRGVKEPA